MKQGLCDLGGGRRLVAPHAGAWIETRERLKMQYLGYVAPHAGAWIETLSEMGHIPPYCESHPTRVRGLKPAGRNRCRQTRCRSHPTRVRGLKLRCRPHDLRRRRVAPHAGAWIETFVAPSPRSSVCVAPHAGAWIETAGKCRSRPSGPSHPTRVRGLKLACRSRLPSIASVAPHAGAWIETGAL